MWFFFNKIFKQSDHRIAVKSFISNRPGYDLPHSLHFIKEEPQIWNDKLKKEIYDACKTIVHHEDAFIDLAFQMGPMEGLTADEVKQYIRFIGNRRLEQLGLNPIYDVKKNPLTWLDTMLNGVEHMNFFEGRATEYSKASTRGSWGEVFA